MRKHESDISPIAARTAGAVKHSYPPPAMRDTLEARRQRALMGRRGCRAATTIQERLSILAYVIWHENAKIVESNLQDQIHDTPGILASYMHHAFRREFRTEAKAAAQQLPQPQRKLVKPHCIHYDPYRIYAEYNGALMCASCITQQKTNLMLYWNIQKRP